MRIWIARPEPGATRTARRLAELGHDPLVAPVLATAPTGAPLPEGPFDGLVLTSANALAAVAGRLPPPVLDRLAAFCVGGRTARAAREAGLAPVHDAGGDAADLARLIRATLAPGSRLLHLAGAERKPEPGASLEGWGYRLTTHVAYAVKPVARLPDEAAAALEGRGGRPLHGVLHYSRRSAETALALAVSAGCDGAFRSLTHYCLSADVAAPLVEGACVPPVVAARPSEDDILALLTDGA